MGKQKKRDLEAIIQENKRYHVAWFGIFKLDYTRKIEIRFFRIFRIRIMPKSKLFKKLLKLL